MKEMRYIKSINQGDIQLYIQHLNYYDYWSKKSNNGKLLIVNPFVGADYEMSMTFLILTQIYDLQCG